jgi:hypothetical protein
LKNGEDITVKVLSEAKPYLEDFIDFYTKRFPVLKIKRRWTESEMVKNRKTVVIKAKLERI